MKAHNTLHPKIEKLPNRAATKPPDKKPALSKDELIDSLEKSLQECVRSAESATVDTIPILLFLGQALNQDDALEDILLHTKDGDIKYCNGGNAVAPILQWLASTLYEGWNEIDASRMNVFGEMRRYRCGRTKAASSRSGRLLGDVA